MVYSTFYTYLPFTKPHFYLHKTEQLKVRTNDIPSIKL